MIAGQILPNEKAYRDLARRAKLVPIRKNSYSFPNKDIEGFFLAGDKTRTELGDTTSQPCESKGDIGQIKTKGPEIEAENLKG